MPLNRSELITFIAFCEAKENRDAFKTDQTELITFIASVLYLEQLKANTDASTRNKLFGYKLYNTNRPFMLISSFADQTNPNDFFVTTETLLFSTRRSRSVFRARRPRSR